MTLGQAILVASKAVPGLLQSCVQSNVGAYAAPLVATNETYCMQHLQRVSHSVCGYMLMALLGVYLLGETQRSTQQIAS